MKKRLPALLLVLILALGLTACGGPGAGPSADPSASPDPPASPEIVADLSKNIVEFSAGLSPEDVLVTVNGEEITADLFCYWLYYNCYRLVSEYGIPVANYADMMLSNAIALTTVYAILPQKAAELGCPLTDEQQASAEASMNVEDSQFTYDQLKALYGMSDASMKFIAAINYYYDNLLSIQADPTEEDLNNYVYQVKHILLKTIDDENNPLNDEAVAQKKAQADELLAQLRALEGEEQLAKFDELMKEYSEDPGLASNPDGYEYTIDDSLVEGFTETALALKPGEISDVLETTYGYHILLRGKVEDLISYADDCKAHTLDTQMDQWLADANVVQSPALDDLDVVSFYERYAAYQQALAEQFISESASPAPEG